ncbi:MAG TPA: site-2 protease family protein [Methylomirabilota bacterium]|nr:site-2 protease family protein [Methylomirabilota bacterium]
MTWSITVGRIAGSEIRIHLTFLILLAWIGIAQYLQGGAAAALDSVLFVIAIFACVVLHELGHAIAARRYGITTPDITLLPIGGLARLSRIPENPTEEIVIAIAGPAVNVVIAVVLIVILGARFDPAALAEIQDTGPGFLARLAAVNIFLVVFNLIPAFPMDGGRVLRALLAYRLGRRRATEIAALIGQGLAFVFGFLGLMAGNPILVFIAIFVFLAATAEAGDVGMRETARRVAVDRAMITTYESLGTQATVDEATDALIRTTQREFPVVDGGGRLRGFLGRDAMIKALKASGPGTPVIDVMTHNIPTVRRGEPLVRVLQLMQENQASEVGVIDENDRLIGYVSRENLAEFMMIGDAGQAAEGPWQPRRA